jgi:hypothetical protein
MKCRTALEPPQQMPNAPDEQQERQQQHAAQQANFAIETFAEHARSDAQVRAPGERERQRGPQQHPRPAPDACRQRGETRSRQQEHEGVAHARSLPDRGRDRLHGAGLPQLEILPEILPATLQASLPATRRARLPATLQGFFASTDKAHDGQPPWRHRGRPPRR